MLLKDLFGEPLKSNYFSRLNYEKKTKKKALFLFKTVSLLLQQSKVLKFNTNLKIIKFYGGGDVFLPSYDKFRGILNRYDVICSTPEVVYKYFTLGFLQTEDLELIIVDECHHAKKFDFMNLIFKHFIFQSYLEVPRIIGLTASPSDDNTFDKKGIENNIQDLCDNLNSKLICSEILIKEVNELKINDKNYAILPLIKNNSHSILKNQITEENKTKEIKNKNNINSFDNPENHLKDFILREFIINEYLANYLKNKFRLKNFCIFNKLQKLIYELLLLLGLFQWISR